MSAEVREPDPGPLIEAKPKQAKPIFPWSRPRPQEEVIHDPEFLARHWLLVGMTILAARQLVESDDPQVKLIGEALTDRLRWFHVDEEAKKA